MIATAQNLGPQRVTLRASVEGGEAGTLRYLSLNALSPEPQSVKKLVKPRQNRFLLSAPMVPPPRPGPNSCESSRAPLVHQPCTTNLHILLVTADVIVFTEILRVPSFSRKPDFSDFVLDRFGCPDIAAPEATRT